MQTEGEGSLIGSNISSIRRVLRKQWKLIKSNGRKKLDRESLSFK